jgi:hypothetical protein
MTTTSPRRRNLLGRTAAAAVAVTGALAMMVAAGPAASASAGCSGSVIRINTGAGAEAPSSAYGHRHRTGNHYIRYRSGNTLYWYADNNGGLDGDTRDTFYRSVYCA